MKDESEYYTIDKNWAKKVEGACLYKKGFLTNRQIKNHKCKSKHHGNGCVQFRDLNSLDESKINFEEVGNEDISVWQDNGHNGLYGAI